MSNKLTLLPRESPSPLPDTELQAGDASFVQHFMYTKKHTTGSTVVAYPLYNVFFDVHRSFLYTAAFC